MSILFRDGNVNVAELNILQSYLVKANKNFENCFSRCEENNFCQSSNKD
jgi:hypothetical protein